MCAFLVATCRSGDIKSFTRVCAFSWRNFAWRLIKSSSSAGFAFAFFDLAGTGRGFFVSESIGRSGVINALFGASMILSSSASVLRIKSRPCINQKVSAIASQS